MNRITDYAGLLRIKHYIKNILVFVPLICSGAISGESLKRAVLAFVSFCLISSGVYIFNDIKDVEKDRLHPTKRNRPVASGRLTIESAKILMVIVSVSSLALTAMLRNGFCIVLLVSYLAVNVAYSIGLKNVPLTDIIILTYGYIVRLVFGSYAVNIYTSNWLYLTAMSAAFYFALGKRRNELKNQKTEARKVLSKYTFHYLDNHMHIFFGLTIVFYALWTVDINTLEHYKNQSLLITVPFVIIILMKYDYRLEMSIDGDPVEVLLKDPLLCIMCLLYIVTMILLLYRT